MYFFEDADVVSIPSLEQTEAFCEYLVNCRSWYKHLPFFPPGARFLLFLNPHAGGEQKENGEVVEILEGNYFRHHSRLSTAEYQRRFGNWDYRVDENPRDLTVPESPRNHTLVPSALPDNVNDYCEFRCTAFLRPAPVMFRLQQSYLRTERDQFLSLANAGFIRRLCRLFSREARLFDAEASRYLPAAKELAHSDESFLPSAELLLFMEAEAAFMRNRLFERLQRFRKFLVVRLAAN